MALWRQLLQEPWVKLPALHASALVRTTRFAAVHLNPEERNIVAKLPPTLDLEIMGANTLPVVTTDVPRVVMSPAACALDSLNTQSDTGSLETLDELVGVDFVEAFTTLYELVVRMLQSREPHLLSVSLRRAASCFPRTLLTRVAPKHPWTVGVLLAFTPYIGAINTHADWLRRMDAAVLESCPPPLALADTVTVLDSRRASMLVAFATVVILSNTHFTETVTLHHMTCVYSTVSHMIQRGAPHAKRVSFTSHELPEGHSCAFIASVLHGSHFTRLMQYTTEMARLLMKVVTAAALPAGPARESLLSPAGSALQLLATGFRCIAENRLNPGITQHLQSPSLVVVKELTPSEFDELYIHTAGPAELHDLFNWVKELEAETPVVYASVVGTTMSGVAVLLERLSDMCGPPQLGGVDYPCPDTGEAACLVVVPRYAFRVWVFYMHLLSVTDTNTHKSTAGEKVSRPVSWTLADMLWENRDSTSTCAMMLVCIASHWIGYRSGTYESIEAAHMHKRFRDVLDRTARLPVGFFPALSYIIGIDLDTTEFRNAYTTNVEPAPYPGSVAAAIEPVFKELGCMESMIRGLPAEQVTLCQSADASTIVIDGRVVSGNVFVATVHRAYNSHMDPHLSMLMETSPVKAHEVKAAIRLVASNRAELRPVKRRRVNSAAEHIQSTQT